MSATRRVARNAGDNGGSNRNATAATPEPPRMAIVAFAIYPQRALKSSELAVKASVQAVQQSGSSQRAVVP